MDEKRIEAAAKELVNALDRCADVINGAFKFAAIHVADYTDAVKLIYGKELDALKRALAGEGEQASPSCGDWGQGVSDTNPKAQEGAIAIPEDLREQYDLHKKWLAIPWHERPRGTASVEAILRENAVNDIERIASLTQRAELAESRVKALSKPVQSEEAARYSRHVNGRLMIPVRDVDALIAARAASGAEEEKDAKQD